MEEKENLDSIDKALLDIIQTDFPIMAAPYAFLGEKLGISADEAYGRVSSMRKRGLIRRLGANFPSAKVGYVSTLCAASVPPEKMEEFISKVNALPGVTHNYERNHEYNIWFTLISSSPAKSAEILHSLTASTGVPILNLPATKLFKIKVDFKMGGGG